MALVETIGPVGDKLFCELCETFKAAVMESYHKPHKCHHDDLMEMYNALANFAAYAIDSISTGGNKIEAAEMLCGDIIKSIKQNIDETEGSKHEH